MIIILIMIIIIMAASYTVQPATSGIKLMELYIHMQIRIQTPIRHTEVHSKVYDRAVLLAFTYTKRVSIHCLQYLQLYSKRLI